MDKRNANMIERNTVNYLVSQLERNAKIRTAILTNDKSISWDGNIELFEDSSYEKDKFVGGCAVQVKGQQRTKLRDLDKDRISYSKVQIADLKNYAKDGGVIYFVVYIFYKEDGDSVKKIYYNCLQELDLREILENHGNQKTVSLEFDAFPDKMEDIEAVLRNFIKHKRKQAILLNNKALPKFPTGTRVRYTVYDDKFTDLLNGKPKYLYGIAGSVEIPYGKILFEEARTNLPFDVFVNEQKYFNHATICIKKGKILYEIILNKGLHLILKGKNSGKLELKENCSLDEYIQNLKFMLAVKREHAFYIKLDDTLFINTKEFQIDDPDDEMEMFLTRTKHIRELLYALHVTKKVLVSKLTHNMICQLLQLHDCIVLHHDYKADASEQSGIGMLELGAYNFYLIKIVRPDGRARWYDFFANDLPMMYESSGGTKVRTGVFILSEDNIFSADNISYENVKKQVLSLSYTKPIGEETNFFILRLLLAYDKGAEKKTELLDCAEKLSEWLWKNDEDSCRRTCHRLNMLQIHARQRTLTEAEKDELVDLRHENAKEWKILAGIAILLHEKSEYRYALRQMNENDKEEFLDSPIMKLLDL